jgi:predicted NUDIX family NTP pyrophosphohydrolase
MAPPKRAAGLLLYRRGDEGAVEVLLVHMGGPFWERKEAGAWSVPKGEIEPGEEPLAAAFREFGEELGSPPPAGEVLDLGTIRQASGKYVTGFAVAGDLDVDSLCSNEVEMEWPRGSGRTVRFPEVDRARWTGLEEASGLLVRGQAELLDRLGDLLAGEGAGAPTSSR